MAEENKIKKYLLGGIKIGVILILFTPLVLGPFGLSFSEYPKTVYFRALTEIILILWAFLVVFEIRNPKSEIRNISSLTPLTVTILIFFAAMTVSSLLGFNIMRSFFGTLEVGGGLITQFHYLAFFFIISSVFKERKDWLLFLRGAVLVSFLSTVAAFLQRFAGLGFYGTSISSERVSGTLSNPVYFGFFTAMAIFLALYLMATESGKREKFLLGGIVLLNIFAILLAGSRGGLLGFSLGIGIIAVLWFFSLPEDSPWRKRALFGLLIFTILVSGGLLFAVKKFPIYSAAHPLFTQWMQVFDLPTILEGRYPGWETAIRAWRDRPIFGWGEASFGYLYDKYFDAHFVKHINAYYVFQDAHNKILNLLAETGLVGAGSYLAIFAVLLIALWKGRAQNQLATFILLGFFANHFVQNLFAFDTASTYILFFLALGFVDNHYFMQTRWKPPPLGHFKIAFAIFLIILSSATFYFVNFKPALAGYDFVRGFFNERTDFGNSIAFYQRGSSRGAFYNRELRLLFASRLLTAMDRQFSEDRKKEVLQKLVDLKALLKPELGKPEFRYLELYKIIAGIDDWLYLGTRNFTFLQEAEEVMRQAVAFNDQWFLHHYYLGRYAIYQGRYEEGEALFWKGYHLSRENTQDLSDMYRGIGVAYWRTAVLGNLPELRNRAADNFRISANLLIAQMRTLSPEQKRAIPVAILKSDVGFIQQTVNLLAQLGRQDEAIKLVEETKKAYGISGN